MRVLRRDIGAPAPVLWLAFAPAVAAIGIFGLSGLRDLRLFAGFVVGLGLGSRAAGGGCGFASVQLVARLRGGVGVSWRYGLANLARRRADSIVQLVAFGMGIMVLLLLAVVRDDLLADWRRSLPTDLPNYFFINIPKEDRATFMSELTVQGARTSRALPMIRARLIAVNDRPADAARSKDPRGEGFARRDQNITWQADLGNDNTLVEGRWWTEADRGCVGFRYRPNIATDSG
jgi:putative ABC transport system permease protein